jgi:hypothetical protein
LKKGKDKVITILKLQRRKELRVAINDVTLRCRIPFHIHLKPILNESQITQNRRAVYLKFLLEVSAIYRSSIPSFILEKGDHAENPLNARACVFAHG